MEQIGIASWGIGCAIAEAPGKGYRLDLKKLYDKAYTVEE